MTGWAFPRTVRAVARDRRRSLERLWREFFSDPSQWWDHRPEKANPSYPDFKQKRTLQGLWLADSSNPSWVRAELAAMAPGSLNPSIFSWNKRLERFVKAGQYKETLDLFHEMQQARSGLIPDRFSFLQVLRACSRLQDLDEGRRTHLQIRELGLESDVHLASCLVGMYTNCGSIDEARTTFDELGTRDSGVCNAMILGYVRCGQGEKAMAVSRQMQLEGIDPDPVTLVGVLNACASTGRLEDGRRIHGLVVERGYEGDCFVESALVDMYSKCGSVENARRVFDRMPTRDVVAWSAMIVGYVRCGDGHQALELAQQMRREGLSPDLVTFVGVLSACSSIAALEEGRQVHEQIIAEGFGSDEVLGNCLIDMYAKCGSIDDAWRVFTKMPTGNVGSWNAMLGGYSRHGFAKEAVQHFERMCEVVEVDGITSVALLSAYSHGGLVDEGLQYFESMSGVYSVFPTVEHYACVVDLLGRSGRLHEAEDLIRAMPCESNASVWMTLLSACKVHGNVEMGERGAKQVLELDPEHAAAYVLLSNIYGAAGMWESSEVVKQIMLKRGVKKEPARSWITVNHQLHSFLVGDCKHPQIVEIHAELERLLGKMKEAGYVADIRFVLHDVDKERKELQLYHHSEKLAIAFGLISTPPGSPLHITNNLRVCGDCHTATKCIAKLVGREIIVRDAHRFHHFQDGLCSCRDFW